MGAPFPLAQIGKSNLIIIPIACRLVALLMACNQSITFSFALYPNHKAYPMYLIFRVACT